MSFFPTFTITRPFLSSAHIFILILLHPACLQSTLFFFRLSVGFVCLLISGWTDGGLYRGHHQVQSRYLGSSSEGAQLRQGLPKFWNLFIATGSPRCSLDSTILHESGNSDWHTNSLYISTKDYGEVARFSIQYWVKPEWQLSSQSFDTFLIWHNKLRSLPKEIWQFFEFKVWFELNVVWLHSKWG